MVLNIYRGKFFEKILVESKKKKREREGLKKERGRDKESLKSLKWCEI